MTRGLWTVLLLAAAVGAGSAGPASERVGRIEGVVLKPDGTAIPNVRVVARTPRGGGRMWDDPYLAKEARTPLPRPASEARTAQDGTFTLLDLDPRADYEVAMEDPSVGAAPRRTGRAEPFRSLPRDVLLVVPDGGPLHGTIRGVPSGSRAWVTLRKTLEGGLSAPFCWRTAWVAADAAGSFEVPRVPPGVAGVLVSVSGHGTWFGHVVVEPGVALVLSLDRMERYVRAYSPRSARGTAPSPPEGAPASGSITGVVRDPDGKPIPGAIVSAAHARPTPTALPAGEEDVRYASSDAKGRYRFPRLPVGTRWLLEASARGAQTRLMERADVVVPEGKGLEVDIPVPHLVELLGRVVLEDGSGVGGVQVDFVQWNSGSAPPPIYPVAVARAVTDAQGDFAIAARGWRLQVVDPAFVQIDEGVPPVFEPGEPIRHVTLRVRRVPPAVWSGVAVDAEGRPLAWQPVWIHARVDRQAGPFLGSAAFGMTDGEGRFRIETDRGPRLYTAAHRVWIDGDVAGEVPFDGGENLKLVLKDR